MANGVIGFILSVIAGVISNYISDKLNRHKKNEQE